ncbi:Polysulfide reductase NrfD [Desulfovibrio sp. X2]|uniref:sulfate reduction electron transfer complex DsrMKJOP subunit DsrP n=1 Tax=Desulfovibrio sp. X2 TaxID=941449 RepID=UPI0003588AF9|nr:NrfD/PsrC family molybdoenzyme membrane anchor subunit [Desulfovibrio sp. X2]EPR40248.1 Polysulfide reductase NrfD [Desulfovibrio sp. X2]
MLETALKGNSRYWGWVTLLLLIMAAGGATWFYQLGHGLMITGMSRDVSWGFYIAQLTYMVGVAAAAVMLVLPYYFHHYKAFKNMIILAEFQAIGAVIICLGSVVVDLGQPQRMMNMILHPTPNSVLFWDMIVLNGYLFLNLLIGWVTLMHQRNNMLPPKWVKPLVYLSIVWAVSIHTVTAFLYQGLPGRHLWLSAIMAPRFLASAFCAGPAILLLVAMILEKVSSFRAGEEAKKAMAKIIVYAMCVNVFFFLCEVFTAFYSNIPGHKGPLEFLFGALHGNYVGVLMIVAVILAAFSLICLIPPKLRDNQKLLPWALVALVIATYIDKGVGLLIGGFTPNVYEGFTFYAPTIPEMTITAGVYAAGALAITILYKVALTVKEETA